MQRIGLSISQDDTLWGQSIIDELCSHTIAAPHIVTPH